MSRQVAYSERGLRRSFRRAGPLEQVLHLDPRGRAIVVGSSGLMTPLSQAEELAGVGIQRCGRGKTGHAETSGMTTFDKKAVAGRFRRF
ncbi:MAG: hypothetical protein J0G94_14070 [Sphingomonadales bacterium]|nr:hypothetical protein [Sphingomonadales bacterium]